MTRRTLDVPQIMAAAERIIDEEGWSGLTIAALAADLGVRGPSLYSHVAGLDQVRAGVQARTMAAISDALRDAAMGRTAGAALHAQCDAWRAFAKAHPNRYLAMTQAPVDADVFLESSAGADVATRAALRAFGLDRDDEESAQFGLFATVHGFVSLEIVAVFTTHLPDDTIDILFRQAVDRVVQSLGRAAATPGAAS
jgi:AcrR family transcriptional regulator